MEFKDIGDTITQSEFNALVYLLRKFKRLTTTLKIGSSDLTSDFGNYHFTSGFKSFGANWILTDDVTITSNDVLKNCYYSFIFTVIDVNLSGEVNRRLVTVDSESTGDDGTLEVTIPSDLIAENEVILTDFNVEVVFDEHEYYTPLPDVEFDISINKRIIVAEESVVITGVLTENGETLPNKIVNLNVGGTVHRLTTDNQGKITYTYTGTGNKGRVIVSAFNEVAWFYDGLDGLLTVTCVKPRIAFGAWLVAEGDVLVDWGDGSSQITQSRGSHLSHDYTDGVTEHIILLDGNITRLGDGCFYSTRAFESITYVGIPYGVKSLGECCFENCRSINKMVIPKSITNIGKGCFKDCFISDYQLYWTENPVPYSTSIYSTNNNPKFTIPYGTMQLYIDAGYPAAKLVERPIEADTINITSTKDILSAHDSESATITATLYGEDILVPNTELDYTIVDKDDNLLDEGTVTTDADGEASIVYTASGVGDVTVTFSLRSLLQKPYDIIDAKYHASNDYINAHLTYFDGTTCFLPYTVQYGDEVCFKFNSKPTHCLVGIGTSSKSSMVLEFNTNSTRIHRSYLNGGTISSNLLNNNIDRILDLKCVNLSASEDKVDFYFDGNYYDYWRNQLRSDNNTIRVDKFTNDDYDIEVYVL